MDFRVQYVVHVVAMAIFGFYLLSRPSELSDFHPPRAHHPLGLHASPWINYTQEPSLTLSTLLRSHAWVEGNTRHLDACPDYEEHGYRDSALRNPRNRRKGGREMVEQASRRFVEGEDPYLFDIALRLVERLDSTKHVCNPCTRRVKCKQPGIGKL